MAGLAGPAMAGLVIYKSRKGVCIMTKGKFGLSLAAVAVIAFAFCALRQPQSVLLVAGFALLAEKDEWLNRQTLQALLLTIAYYLAELVTGWVFGGLARLFGWVKLYGAADAMSTAGSFLGDVFYLALIVFSVLAVLRVLRGKDAGLPFISKMMDGDIVAPSQTQYAPPAQPPASIQTPPAAAQNAPASVARLCPACSAPLHKDSRFCTECGAKVE